MALLEIPACLGGAGRIFFPLSYVAMASGNTGDRTAANDPASLSEKERFTC